MNRMVGSLAATRRMRFRHLHASNSDVMSSGVEWRWVRKCCRFTSSNAPSEGNGVEKKNGFLEVEEVKEILKDVRADDVKVIPISPTHHPSPPPPPSSPPSSSSWMDYMVIATGRSPWHVRNIAQSLIHRVKEKQKGAEHMVLPRVHGYQGGKWIVVDSGNVVVHALDEKARIYYNLENLYAERTSNSASQEDLYLLLGQPPEEPPTC